MDQGLAFGPEAVLLHPTTQFRANSKLSNNACAWARVSLDELDALEKAHDLEEAQNLDGAQDALAAAHGDLCVARIALLETRFVNKCYV